MSKIRPRQTFKGFTLKPDLFREFLEIIPENNPGNSEKYLFGVPGRRPVCRRRNLLNHRSIFLFFQKKNKK